MRCAADAAFESGKIAWSLHQTVSLGRATARNKSHDDDALLVTTDPAAAAAAASGAGLVPVGVTYDVPVQAAGAGSHAHSAVAVCVSGVVTLVCPAVAPKATAPRAGMFVGWDADSGAVRIGNRKEENVLGMVLECDTLRHHETEHYRILLTP